MKIQYDSVTEPKISDGSFLYSEWGGICKCPNGKEYETGGIRGTTCIEIACFGGEMISCNSQDGPWRNKKVNCDVNFLFLFQIFIFYCIGTRNSK